MTETIENPVIQDNEFESQLREAAEKADRGEEYTLPSAEQSEIRAPDKTAAEETVSSPDTTPETETTDERPRDELGRFTKTEDGKDIPESERTPVEPAKAVTEPKKPDSPYVKAQKDQERLNRNRQEFEAEKARERAAIEAEKQRLAQERQYWEQQRQQPQQNGNQPQYTAKDYKEFAAECTRKAKLAQESGDPDEALRQSDLAVQATIAADKAAQFEQTNQYNQAAQQYEALWTQDMNERIRQEPELAKPDSSLSRQVQAIMSEYPGVFDRIPPMKLPNGKVMGGFSFAAEVAKLRLQAGAASGLEQKNKQLQAEVDQLRKATQINGSGPTSHSGPKRFEDMTIQEMEAHLKGQDGFIGQR